jgi:hypothetical protein
LQTGECGSKRRSREELRQRGEYKCTNKNAGGEVKYGAYKCAISATEKGEI